MCAAPTRECGLLKNVSGAKARAASCRAVRDVRRFPLLPRIGQRQRQNVHPELENVKGLDWPLSAGQETAWDHIFL